MKNTRNKVVGLTFVFLLILAIGFFVKDMEASIWKDWFAMMQWLLAFWFGSKTITDVAKSKWYRSELDDEHKNENK